MNKPEKSNEVKVLCGVKRLVLKYLTIFSMVGVLASAHAQGNASYGAGNPSLMSIITSLILDEDDEPIGPYPTAPVFGPEPVVPLPAAAKSMTRKTAYEYDSATGLLIREIVEPDNPQLRLEVSYPTAGYDNYGNRTVASVSSPATGTAAIASRTASIRYDSRGRFISQVANVLGQSTTTAYDSRFGLITRMIDVNEQAASFDYDDFGRMTQQRLQDGRYVKWEYLYCSRVNGGSNLCPSEAKYVVIKTPYTVGGAIDGPWEKVFYDAFERMVETNTVGFDGATVIRSTVKYDQSGNVYQVSRPYYSTQSPALTTYYYDIYDRLKSVNDPSDRQTVYDYNGQTTSVTNSLKQTTTQIRDIVGRLITVKDSSTERNEMNYRYDPLGNLTHAIDANGNTTSMAYNLLGHKLQTVDPDMGSWTYASDVLGNVIRQTDAKGQITTYAFDKLGRLTNRNESDLVSSWIYDSCERGVGEICYVNSNNGYAQKYSYDSHGRLTSLNTKIDASYLVSVSYDSNGRTSTLTYPSGLVLKYKYTSLGYLEEIRDNATNGLYWKLNDMDAEGNLLLQTYGNGIVTQQVFHKLTGRLENIYAGAGNGIQNLSVVYDEVGNVFNRKDANQGLNEGFLYDELQRITNSTVNSGLAGIQSRSYDYDAIGNIKSLSDTGFFIPGSKNARPHGVYKISYPNQSSRIFSYDANGNLSGDSQYDEKNNFIYGTTRKISYTSFNMPAKIIGQNSSLSFNYGADHQRTRMDGPSGTKIYVHPDNSGSLMFDKEIKFDQSVVFNNYISVGGQVIALLKQTSAGMAINYLHQDHLGSVSTITNETGAVVERLSYEPFGKRRASSGASASLSGRVNSHGFTNAEHLEEFGLINLNGRIYDPQIGRFISADPFVPHPGDMQSFNRYSYVRNNPLRYVDPTGYRDSYPFSGNLSGMPSIFPSDGNNPGNNWGFNLTLGGGGGGGGGGGNANTGASTPKPPTATPTNAIGSSANIGAAKSTAAVAGTVAWQVFEQASAERLEAQGYTIARQARLTWEGAKGSYVVMDTIGSNGKNIVLMEAKDGIASKLSSGQKLLFEAAFKSRNLLIMEAKVAGGIGLKAGIPLAKQGTVYVSVDTSVMGARAARQFTRVAAQARQTGFVAPRPLGVGLVGAALWTFLLHIPGTGGDCDEKGKCNDMPNK